MVFQSFKKVNTKNGCLDTTWKNRFEKISKTT